MKFSAKKIFAFSGALLLAACATTNTATTGNSSPDNATTRERANRAYDSLDEEYSTTKDSKSMSKASVAEAEKSKAALKKFSCPAGSYLRGEAFAQSEAAALQLAQKNIANQIQSTVVSVSSQYKSQVEDAAGRELIQSSYEVASKVYSQLENAQDARQVGSVEVDGRKVGVVACMSVEDAMKPFVQKFGVLQDSVVLMSETYNGMEHPLKKMDAYNKGREVYYRMVAVKNVMESFSYSSEDVGEKAFVAMNEKFRQFKSHYAFFYNAGNGGELEQAAFGRLSQKYHLVAGECSGGVQLSVEASEPECGSGSLGYGCSAVLTLKGTSCFGDAYFVQKATVKGISPQGEPKDAMKRVVKHISSGDWFNSWAAELDKWNVK